MIRTLRIPDKSCLTRPVADLLRLTAAKTAPVAETAAVAGPGDVVRKAVELARRGGEKRPAGVAAKLLEGLFDFDDMARRCLGAHWDTRSPAERTDFTRLFRGHMARTYSAWFAGTVGQVVLSGGVADGTCATVWSTTRRAHASRRIEHRLRQAQGAWLVYDLLLEGDSLIEQQRQRLERSIQESSWDEALWHLRLHDLQAVASDEITRPRRR